MAAPIRFNVLPDARGLHINRPNINNVGRAYMYFSVDIDRFSVSDGTEWLNPDDYDPGTLMTRLGYTVPSPSVGGGISIGDSITGGDPGAVLTIDSLGNLSEGNNLIFTDIPTGQFVVGDGTSLSDFSTVASVMNTLFNSQGLTLFNTANTSAMNLDGINTTYFKANGPFNSLTATVIGDDLWGMFWTGMSDSTTQAIAATLRVTALDDFATAPSTRFKLTVLDPASDILLSADDTNVLSLAFDTFSDSTTFATQLSTGQLLVAGGGGASTLVEFTDAGTFYQDNIGRFGLSIFDTNNTIVTSIDGNAITHIKANDGFTSPTQVLTGNNLGSIDWWGLDDSVDLVLAARLTVIAGEDFLSGARSSLVRLQSPGNTGSIELDVSGESVSLFIESTGISLNANRIHVGALPTSDPLALGDLWNNGGVLTVSAG